MTWRKVVVRGLVFTVAVAIGAGAVAYQHWTDPAEVRRHLLRQLSARFPGATITADSARLRLLGGIVVSEVRMTRRDDADMLNFLYVPTAIIYHDKERLLDGRFSIRKMELDRPRFHVLRDEEGRWNLAGLLAPPDPSERIPTILIKQGTIIVEDRRAHGSPPLEIKDVSLTIINDPEQTVTFEGSGVSSVTGPVQMSGSWQRDGGQASLTVDATVVPVGPVLVQRLAGVCPELGTHAEDLTGSGNLHATLDFRPESARPWEHDVTFTLTGGRFSHKQFPLTVEGITASLHCVNGHISKAEARGHAGATAVHVTVDDITLPLGCTGPESCCTLEDLFQKLEITIDNIPVTEELFKRLPEKAHTFNTDYSPSGPLNIRYLLWHDGAKGLRKRVTLSPDRMSACFKGFKYPVERITGTLIHNSGGGEPDRLNVDLVGYASNQPVGVKVVLTGTRPELSAVIDVQGKNIPLDEKLLDALPEAKHKTLAASFHPTGLADFHAHCEWRRDPALAAGGWLDCRYVIDFHDATMRYKPFDYRLEKVKGTLDIQHDHWEFRSFEGRHGDGMFYTAGRSRREAGDKESVDVAIAGRGVSLDADLQRALREDLQRTWDTFKPEGTIDFDGTLHIPPADGREAVKDPMPDIVLTVVPRDCRITPKFFAYLLSDLRGKVHFEKGIVELENITARHDGSSLGLDRGIVQLKPGGGFKADLVYLHGDPLVTDRAFITALPPALQKGVSALAIDGPVQVTTRLYIDAPSGTEPPRIYWDGWAALHDVTLHTGVKLEHVSGTVAVRGWHNGRQIDGVEGNLDIRTLTVFDQPIRNLRGELLVTEDEPDVLKCPGLMADYFGGQVYGPLRVEFGPKLHYRLNLTAAQVKLEEFGRHNFNNRDLNGLAVARIYLEGEGAEISGLKGNGRIDVPSGHLYNLPLLLDLLKFLGLRLPDRTAFEEAHLVFDIEGARAHVKQLELYGNAISLRGSGDTNIDGSDLAFIFYLDWARLGQVLPAGVREIPREISNQLLRIEMRGKVGDVRFRKEPIPLLLDPLRKAFVGDDDAAAKH